MSHSFHVRLPLPRRRAAGGLRDQMVDYLRKHRPAVGSRFVSDHELVRLSRLSRPTVRRALDELVREGWIERRHGVGTFVGPRLSLASFEQPAAQAGKVRLGRVAVLVHYPGEGFGRDCQTAGVVAGMNAAAGSQGISIEMLGVKQGDPSTIIRRIVQGRPDVLVAISPRPRHALIIAEAKRLGMGVLLTGSRLLDLGLPTVREDGAQGARLAVEHLVRLGHRRIGLVLPAVPAPWVFERRGGFLAALRDASLEADESLVFWGADEPHADTLRAISAFLHNRRLTALVVGSGGMTERLAPAVESGELRIGADLSLVTFDQMWEKRAWAAGLRPTVIALPLKQIGQHLVELARAHLDGKPVESPAPLPCELIEGDTAAAPGSN